MQGPGEIEGADRERLHLFSDPAIVAAGEDRRIRSECCCSFFISSSRAVVVKLPDLCELVDCQINKQKHLHTLTTNNVMDADCVEGSGPPRDHDFGHLRKSSVSATTVTIICSVLGVGILSMPGSFSRMGWIIGSLMIGTIGAFGLYCSCLLGKCMMGTADNSGKRIRSYPELGDVCFGRKGRILAHIGTYGTCVGVGMLFLILAAESFSDLSSALSKQVFTCVSAIIVLPTVLCKTLHGATILSTMGFVASLLMGVIILVENIYFLETQHRNDDDGEGVRGETEIFHQDLFDYGYAFSGIIFGFGGVCCWPEAISTMKRPEKFNVALYLAYPCVILIYYIVSLSSYEAYGSMLYAEEFNGNVALNLPENFGQDAISVAIIVHVLSAFIVYMIPFFREVEIACRFDEMGDAFLKRSAFRVSVIGCMLLLVLVFPFFDDIVSLLGATTQSLSCFLIPIACYWHIYGRMTWERSFAGQMEICIQVFIFVLVLVLGAIGSVIAVKNIVDKSSTYTIFQ
eukprot:Nk52_evm26s684 gene=Nk52_evmTU26s684